MKRNYLNLILTILVVIFSLIIIYQLILKISGYSPTDFAIIYSFIGLLITNTFIIYGKFNGINYKLGRLESKLDNLINQFSALASDFKEHLKRKWNGGVD